MQTHRTLTGERPKSENSVKAFFAPQQTSGSENLESMGFHVQENIIAENRKQMTGMNLENLNYIHLIFNTIFSIRMGVFR